MLGGMGAAGGAGIGYKLDSDKSSSEKTIEIQENKNFSWVESIEAGVQKSSEVVGNAAGSTYGYIKKIPSKIGNLTKL